MRITKFCIEDFGKFHRQKIEFAPGLNILTGANESGKTTVRRFLRAMLYGLDRERGLRARTDDYTRYLPWESGRFQGSMEFTVDGDSCRMFRNFKTTEKTLQITNLTTGKQVSEPENFLKNAGLISESAYCNTLWVGNVCETEEELSEELQNYLANIKMTGAVGLDVQKSLDWLKERKKELQRKLPEQELSGLRTLLFSEEEERRNYEELCRMQKQLALQEEDLKKEERRQMTETAFPAEPWEVKRAELEKELQQQKKVPGLAGSLLVCGGCFLLASLLIFALLFFGTSSGMLSGGLLFTAIPVVLSAASLAALLSGGILLMVRKKRLKEAEEALKDMEQKLELAAREFSETQKTRMQERMEALFAARKQLLAATERNLWEMERAEERLNEIEQAKDRILELEQKKEELFFELKALELAAEKMEKASGALYDDFGQRFGASLSWYVQAFTDRAYERLVADETLTLGAITEERTVSAGDVSFGTKEQFYLALRLAAADVFDEKKKLPLVLDDSFAAFDEQRLESALMCLAACGRQVLLFSSTGREERTAKRMGIAYETVFWDNRENIVEFD